MISDAHAEQLLAIADQLERLPLASHRDPEQPHVARSELARALRGRVYEMRRALPSAASPDAIRPGTITVAGRTIPVVTRRRP